MPQKVRQLEGLFNLLEEYLNRKRCTGDLLVNAFHQE